MLDQRSNTFFISYKYLNDQIFMCVFFFLKLFRFDFTYPSMTMTAASTTGTGSYSSTSLPTITVYLTQTTTQTVTLSACTGSFMQLVPSSPGPNQAITYAPFFLLATTTILSRRRF